jgi:hypothetical protein
LPGHVGADAEQCVQPRVDCLDQRGDQRVELVDLVCELLVTPRQRPQRDHGSDGGVGRGGAVGAARGADLDETAVAQLA